MKRLIYMAVAVLSCFLCLFGCKEKKQGWEMYINDKRVYVSDFVIRNEYVVLPLYKILCSIGQLESNSNYNTYSSCCMTINGVRYVIDFDEKVIIQEDEMIRIEKEHSDVKHEGIQREALLCSSNEKKEYGPNAIVWEIREIYIGQDTLIQLMEKMGVEATVEWDSENRFINISFRCQD